MGSDFLNGVQGAGRYNAKELGDSFLWGNCGTVKNGRQMEFRQINSSFSPVAHAKVWHLLGTHHACWANILMSDFVLLVPLKADPEARQA